MISLQRPASRTIRPIERNGGRRLGSERECWRERAGASARAWRRRLELVATGLLIAVAVAVGPLPARAATTYYVAPTGSDTAAGALTSPFATMAHAQVIAAPGDTVYFRAGTYAYTSGLTTCSSGTDTINAIVLGKSGTVGNLIHYLAYPGETPVFDFSGIKDSCRVKGFLVSGSWLHLRGLEIKGVPQNNNLNHESWGVWVSGSNNTFERLDIHHNMGPGLFIENGGNNLVLNCDSHENYDPLTSNGAGQSADGFGCHIAVGGTGNVFRGCRAWWNSDDGWDFIHAAEVVTVENSWAWNNGYLPGTTMPLAAGNGNGFKGGGFDVPETKVPAQPPSHVIRNCLSFSNKAAGFYANHEPVADHFYNNTSYNNHPDFDLLGMLPDGTVLNVGILRNNIAFAGTLLSNASGPMVDESHNSWDMALGVTVSNADFQSTSMTGVDGPRQADGSLPCLPFMRLAAGSDLIDKGQDVGLPFTGAAPDLGAFESGSCTGSSSPGSGGGPGTGGGAGGRGGGGAPAMGTGGRAGGPSGGNSASGGALGVGNGGATGGDPGTGGVSGGTATGGATAPPTPGSSAAGCGCRTGGPQEPARELGSVSAAIAVVGFALRRRRSNGRVPAAPRMRG